MKKFLIIIFSFVPSLVFSSEKGLDKKIDEAFTPVSDFFSQLVFFEILGYPFVILLLVFWFSKFEIFLHGN
jgi:AGCS family alanine or glycine:cation symporter